MGICVPFVANSYKIFSETTGQILLGLDECLVFSFFRLSCSDLYFVVVLAVSKLMFRGRGCLSWSNANIFINVHA